MSFLLALPFEPYRGRVRLLLYIIALTSLGLSLLILILLFQEHSYIFTQHKSSKVGAGIRFYSSRKYTLGCWNHNAEGQRFGKAQWKRKTLLLPIKHKITALF